jgi:hypothetical protein
MSGRAGRVEGVRVREQRLGQPLPTEHGDESPAEMALAA